MPPPQAASQGAKRRPYASRACIECQRRKTKCNEEQPCPSCRIRRVECKYGDTDNDICRPATTKRPRLGSRAADGVPPPISSHQNLTPITSNDTSTQGPPTTETRPANASSDAAIEALREEIRSLRHDFNLLTDLRKSGEPWQHPSLSTETPFQQQSEFLYPPSIQGVLPEGQNEFTPSTTQTDTFEPSGQWDSPIAIANKIGAMRRKVVLNSNLDDMSIVKSTKTVSLALPPPVQLRRQIDLFLSEFDDYSPFFRRSCLQKRMASALHSLSYGERQTVVYIPWQHCTTFAILCCILSCAEIFSSTNSTLDPHTGHHWFVHGKRLMEEFEESIEYSLDVVVYHVLVAGNMMEAERLRAAALHIVRASHAALCIGLNDVKRWKPLPDEIVSRSCLWWVLNFLEKRIHWKCGVPYFLRPSEVNVDESPSNNGDPEIEHTKLELVESMISYSKLWTSIWQDFMAPTHLTQGWAEVQIADAKVMIAYQQLPSRLLWETEKVPEYLDSAVAEPAMRQKLQVYLWHQSLRLIIRQSRVSSPQGDLEWQRSRFSICKHIIAAIASYMKKFVCMRPIGYFLTCALVECLFHIKHEQSSQSTMVDQADVQQTLETVGNLLETLAISVGSARRALAALRCVLTMSNDWNPGFDVDGASGPSATIQGLQDLPFERGRAFQVGCSDMNVEETLQFLGLVPM